MVSSPNSGFPPAAPATSRCGAGAGDAVFTILAGSLYPIALLDHAWQLKLGGALINASPYPLLALGLIHAAFALKPGDPLMPGRCRWVRRLAEIRSASASIIEGLKNSLTSPQGPSLTAADRQLPLQLLRGRVNAMLDQASGQTNRARTTAIENKPSPCCRRSRDRHRLPGPAARLLGPGPAAKMRAVAAAGAGDQPAEAALARWFYHRGRGRARERSGAAYIREMAVEDD